MLTAHYPLVGQAYTERSPDWDGQTCVNFYLSADPLGKREMILAPTPGTHLRKTLEESQLPVRAVYSNGTELFAVVNNRVYACDHLFSLKKIGVIHSPSGFISMVHNNNMLILVDGSGGYTYDFSSSKFSEISGAGFPEAPQMIEYLDGYFICVQGDSNVFHLSRLNNANEWDSNDFALAQSCPGKLVGLATLHGRLYLFSEYSTEVWYNAGAADFPLRRDNNYLMEFGCAAIGSIAKGHGYLFWLARSKEGIGSVKMVTGSMPHTISTSAIQFAIQQYSSVENAFGFVYQEAGHLFYQLTFPEANVTWIYDATMNQWSQLKDGNGDRHCANCHTFFNGEHIVGDKQMPKLLALSCQYPTDCNELIKRERIGPHFFDPSNNNIRISAFDLLLETGQGLEQGIGANPKALLSSSRNGGHFFGNKHAISLGKQGEFAKRVICRRLGMARDFVFKLEIAEPISPYIFGANIHYEVMNS